MPQLIMVNHAAWVNQTRMDLRLKQGRETGEYSSSQDAVADTPIYNGKRLNELTSDEYVNYLNS